MDQNHSHMPILYKMVCKKIQLYKVDWLRHFWQHHPLYKLDRSMPILYKMVCKKIQLYKVTWMMYLMTL